MFHRLGGTRNLGDARSVSVSGLKGEMSGAMVLRAGVETDAMEWGPALEHHEPEIGTTEESAEMWLQPSCV